jgi:hypothetical protein
MAVSAAFPLTPAAILFDIPDHLDFSCTLFWKRSSGFFHTASSLANRSQANGWQRIFGGFPHFKTENELAGVFGLTQQASIIYHSLLRMSTAEEAPFIAVFARRSSIRVVPIDVRKLHDDPSPSLGLSSNQTRRQAVLGPSSPEI